MSKPEILVVDDDVSVAESISDVLDAVGYGVSTAHDGYRAIELAKDSSFDVLLTDIKMPGLNGVELYKIIKKVRPLIRAIMMTAYSVEDLINEALDAGASEVLTKPLDVERLLSIIESADAPSPE